jgi:integrase/recombinase XerD
MDNSKWKKKETDPIKAPTYKEWLEAKKYKKSTIKEYQRSLSHLQNYVKTELKYLRYPDLIKYISELQKQVKAQTIIQRLISIKSYYNYLLEQEEIDHNPAKTIKIRNQKQLLKNHLKQEELETLYQEFTPVNQRDKVLLGLLIYQGAESGVLQKLQVTDLNLEQGTVLFRNTTRSNKRTLSLHSSQILPLFKYLQSSEIENLVFPQKLNNRLHYLLKQLKKQNEKVESIRQLRASVITNWLKIYNLRQVQYMAGHRYVSSTEAYQEKDLEALKAGIKKYHPLG